MLTAPAREAFKRLHEKVSEPDDEGFLTQTIFVEKADVCLLLVEVIVSVGYEVDLAAAQAVIARLVEMLHDSDRDGHITARKIRALLVAYYGDEGIPPQD